MRRPSSADRSASPQEAFRGFVAVLLPEPLRAEVARVSAPLHGLGSVKWVAPENYHFTLKFLGQVPLTVVPALAGSLRGVAAAAEPFELEIAGVGAFPSIGRPQTVWAGVAAGREHLEALAAATEEASIDHGFAREERQFHAHLTLGRVPSPVGRETLAARLRATDVGRIGATEVTSIHLIQSRLSPQGASYSIEEAFPLGGESR